MILKGLFKKAGIALRTRSQSRDLNDSENLDMVIDIDPLQTEPQEPLPHPERTSEVVIKQAQPMDKAESAEMLQKGFGTLIEQLKGINQHLNHQVNQHAELMDRIDQLPNLLEKFPAVLANQKQTVDELLNQLKAAAFKNQQFVEAVEKIPGETVKQTDALVNINNQLSASAETDVQMTESFNKFNRSLEKLDSTTGNQTDSIMQMSKTFATSDRYLKYLMSKQNKRFVWVFIISVGVCLFSIITLTGIIAFLLKQTGP